jgi:hypothetical protein
MRLTFTTAALALSFALAAPVSAYAYDGSAPGHQQSGRVSHAAHVKISPTATALAPTWAMSPAGRVPETDGLSRNPDDCNYGCIDN